MRRGYGSGKRLCGSAYVEGMRTLLGEDVNDAYAWPEGDWLRANMVSSLDGAATGPDGRSGGVNNAVDQRVFHQIRESADAIVVGAGTARAESYGPATRPLVVVGSSLPPTLHDAPGVRLEPGGDAAALRDLVSRLHAEGLRHLVTEGGPRLLGDLLRAGLVDELCLTLTPRLLAGGMTRILVGDDIEVPLTLVGILEEGNTLLTRWHVAR